MYLDKLKSGKFEVKDQAKVRRFILPLNAEGETNSDLLAGTAFAGAATLDQKGNCVKLTPTYVAKEGGCEHPVINPNVRGHK
jgi:hypothetical protein